MPRGDGTGPVGAGCMTGAGAGRANGARARGFGGAGGHGCRRMYNETGLPGWVRAGDPAYHADAGELLAKEADRLESRLKQVQEQMANLSAPNEEMKEEVRNPENEGQ